MRRVASAWASSLNGTVILIPRARLAKVRGAMTEAGLMSRSAPDPNDRRRVGLIATQKGQNLMKAMKRRRTDWLAQKLAGLSPKARPAIRNAIGPLSEIGR
jgi:DNA-binding MarR family transcriptional regulator